MKDQAMMKRYSMSVLAAAVLATGIARAQEEAKPAAPSLASLEKQEAQLKAAAPAMVIVEYTLQYDKGDAPVGGGFREKCASCGRYHSEGLGDVVKEERPLERAGVLIDGTHVLTADPQIHPRFIKSIAVRRQGPDNKTKPVAATIFGYPKQQNGIVLELSGAIEGAAPLVFDAKREGPLSVVTTANDNGNWTLAVQSFGGGLVLVGDKKLTSGPPGIVVDKNGAAVGVSTGVELPSDGSWKGNPMEWPMISAAEMKKSLATLDERAAKSIVRVMLNFRSPKSSAMDAYRGNGEAGATVQYHLGVLTDQNTVLVLTELKPTQTARLERIKVFVEPAVEAKFKASLKDYGAFVATLEKPAPTGLALSEADVQSLKGTILPTAEVFLQGDKRVSYVQPRRIAGFNTGWRRNMYPEMTGETKGLFLFDPTGAMVAMPMARREKASVENRYSRGDWLITPVAQVLAALKDPKENTDPGNVPLTEEQENRLAWVGFEMQALSPELARANNVSDQTNDGESGAMVTYVYPDSPAAKAGVEPGWVLLRIEAENQPKPIDVKVTNEPYAERPFPWDQLATVPEAYFDRVLEYSPWPRAENTLVRTITDLGFNTKYTAEFFHDGKIDKKPFTVIEGPAHWDSAPKYKDARLGFTVKDMTYEVRRYMQKKADDPGVIIGKIEMGSKASKAGVKPYEVITHVNDQPVLNVKDFEKLMKDQKEVRLSVKRMTNGRIVKIKLDEPAGNGEAPATAPGAAPAPAAPGGPAVAPAPPVETPDSTK
jgi:hypothetical protein